MIELEENTKRKDLTEYEKSKNLTEMVEVTKEILKEKSNWETVSQKKSNAEKPDSDQKVAEKLGIEKRNISNAKQHVNAVENYPNLVHLPKMDAIKTAKEPTKMELLNKAFEEFPEFKKIQLPADRIIHRAEKLRTLSTEERENYFSEAREIEAEGKQQLKQIDEDYKRKSKIEEAINYCINFSDRFTEENIECWLRYTTNRNDIDAAVSDIQLGIDSLENFQTQLKNSLKGPRKAVNNYESIK